VILGDNILEKSIASAVEAFEQQERGARILLKQVTDAERFGVAELDGTRIIGIEEKPRKPKSNYAVTGIYMYDETVFEKVRELVPSGRGELEITDVNNAYIREGTMTFSYVEGWWTDAGTFESRFARPTAHREARSGAPRRKPTEFSEFLWTGRRPSRRVGHRRRRFQAARDACSQAAGFQPTRRRTASRRSKGLLRRQWNPRRTQKITGPGADSPVTTRRGNEH
jgi:hypothetical protein